MQLKLYKRNTALLSFIVLINIISIVLLYLNKEQWVENKLTIIAIYVISVLILTFVYAYIDLNIDKIIIKKRIKNGDVAMAKIINGSFVRFTKDAKLKGHVLWQLDVDIYDNDMNIHKAKIIDKFSLHQTKIPKGFVFITYIEGKEDDSLIVPNVIISSIPEYKVLVDEYEKSIKPKYLNAYYNDGLILQTYEDMLKENKDN